MRRDIVTLLSCIVGLASASLGSAAQLPGTDGAVTGTGTATITRPPNVLRVEIQLSAEGKDMKEALAKLGQRRDACQKKLAGLGAKDDTIRFDPPKLDVPDPRQQMEQMMRRRMANSGGPRAATAPGGAAAPVSRRVVQTARAEWPLDAKTPEDLLVTATDLQDKVKAADLAENKLASLEEQEAREERAGSGDPSEQGVAPGEPMFLYVARISPAERATAVADAFRKAKANATDLAKAAGAELGALKQLQSQDVPDGDQYQLQMMLGRYRGGSMYQQGATTDPEEALSPQPGQVTVRVAVAASFLIK